ncbi:unnamed protein product [Prunus brigantina]
MARMQLQVQHMIFILLLLWHITTTSTSPTSSKFAAPAIAKPNCRTHCGNVSIPYPFGIGPNKDCYFDEWFQLECNKSTGDKPFLRLAQLEVLRISIKGMLQFKYPVTFFSCKGKETRQAPNLTGSPFLYSGMDSVHVVLDWKISLDNTSLRSFKGFIGTEPDYYGYKIM